MTLLRSGVKLRSSSVNGWVSNCCGVEFEALVVVELDWDGKVLLRSLFANGSSVGNGASFATLQLY